MYPKEIGQVLITMGIGPGMRVLECGSGSGGLTTAFAYMVGDCGHVYSYERNQEIQALAIKTWNVSVLFDRVTFKVGDASEGFSEENVDALFLDLPNPYDYLAQARASLKPGGYLGMLVPTVNQVQLCLRSLMHNNFAFVEVVEVLVRYYKTDWEHLRPVDRMIAHTGFLLFGRAVERLGLEKSEDAEPSEMDETEEVL